MCFRMLLFRYNFSLVWFYFLCVLVYVYLYLCLYKSVSVSRVTFLDVYVMTSVRFDCACYCLVVHTDGVMFGSRICDIVIYFVLYY
jgi:hypothetical protein